MKNSGLAIFASGTGSNANKIIEYFRIEGAQISCIVSNKSDAGVLDLARKHGIPQIVLERKKFYSHDDLLAELKDYKVKYIALAGFLWLIPGYLLKSFKNRIVNIHPALLPKYGGKGMYGENVHKAIKESGDLTSGMTIHLVNEAYDEGKIIFQASCQLSPDDTPKEIARKVLSLEHKFYPVVLSSFMEFQS